MQIVVKTAIYDALAQSVTQIALDSIGFVSVYEDRL